MKDFESDPTYSSIENPTAAYPRAGMSSLFDEDSEASGTPAPVARSSSGPASDRVSWLYLGLALLGGGMLAVGVSGLVAVLVYAS